MHISVNDSGSENFKVLLDGVEQTYCVEADDVEGWCRCLLLDEDGLVIMGGATPLTEKKTGRVMIVGMNRNSFVQKPATRLASKQDGG